MRSSIFILILLFGLNLPRQVYAQDLTPDVIFKMVNERFQLDELNRTQLESIANKAADQTSFDNPSLSFGRGRLNYNGGAGISGYNEVMLSQNFSLNGRKDGIQKKADLGQKIEAYDLLQFKLKLMSQAIEVALWSSIALEKAGHVAERQKYLELVSKFLKSRKFSSPKQRLDFDLIKNKMEHLELHGKDIAAEFKSATARLQYFLGQVEPSSLRFNFLSLENIEKILSQFTDQELLLEKSFKVKQNVREVEMDIARKSWIPDVQLYYSYTDEQFFGGNQNQVVGLGMEVPLFNVGSNRRQAVSNIQVSEKIKYKAKLAELQSEKAHSINQVKMSLNFLRIYSAENLAKKEKRMSQVKNEFKKGMLSAANFLEFEEQIHLLQYQRLDHYFNIYQNLFSLTVLYGREDIFREILR